MSNVKLITDLTKAINEGVAAKADNAALRLELQKISQLCFVLNCMTGYRADHVPSDEHLDRIRPPIDQVGSLGGWKGISEYIRTSLIMLRDTMGGHLEKDIRARSETMALEGLLRSVEDSVVQKPEHTIEVLDVQEVRDLIPAESSEAGSVVIRKREHRKSPSQGSGKQPSKRSWLFT